MAIVNVSLDTATRQTVLTINGVLVSSDEFNISKYLDIDEESVISFGYTVETVDDNGLKERRQFYLPSVEELATEAHTGVDKDGLASRAVRDDEKAKLDIIEFIKQGKNPS